MKRAVGILLIFISIFIFANYNKSVFADGYCLTINACGREYIYYYPEISLVNGEYRLKDKEGKIDRIVRDSYVFAQNAQAIALNPNEITVIKEKLGRCVDGDFLSVQIDKALKSRSSKITAVTKKVFPEMDSAYINRCLNLKSNFTTYYYSSSQERKQNIKLACQKLNGLILFSGEEFSFNKAVGKRTEENGFKNAKVILDGQFVEGIGGGVCQVSTTLYNAALLAGLTISESHPHSLAVSYVEKSFDAMVTDLWADLRFINDTNGLIFIFAKAEQNYLVISIYGVENAYDYKRVSVIEEELLPEDKIEYVTGLLKGEKVQKVVGKKGFKSKGFLERYYKGQIIDNVQIRADEYKKIDNLILVGA